MNAILALLLLVAASSLVEAAPPADVTHLAPSPYPMHVQTVHRFRKQVDGWIPAQGVTLGPDGRLYGTTDSGETGEGQYASTLFRIDRDGTHTVLKYFVAAIEGQEPQGGVVFGLDGQVYGVMGLGGGRLGGTIYRIATDGSGFTILHHFFASEDDPTIPQRPAGGLVLASDGYFYGTTSLGGADFGGTIFRMSHSGDMNFVHGLGEGTAPSWPRSTLIQASDGWLYGSTSRGGEHDLGAIYRISTNGEYQTLHSFTEADGGDVDKPLVEEAPGVFYGVSRTGGAYREGTVFRITQGGELRVMHDFGAKPHGARRPSSALRRAANGQFYGTTLYGGRHGLGTVYRINREGAATTVLYFGKPYAEGFYPVADALEMDDEGWMYATCSSGGVQIGARVQGAGTVFRFRPPSPE